MQLLMAYAQLSAVLQVMAGSPDAGVHQARCASGLTCSRLQESRARMALAAKAEEESEAHISWAHAAVSSRLCQQLPPPPPASLLPARPASGLTVPVATCATVAQAAEELLQEAAEKVQQKHWRSALAAEAEAVAGIRQEAQDTVEKVRGLSLVGRHKRLQSMPFRLGQRASTPACFCPASPGGRAAASPFMPGRPEGAGLARPCRPGMRVRAGDPEAQAQGAAPPAGRTAGWRCQVCLRSRPAAQPAAPQGGAGRPGQAAAITQRPGCSQGSLAGCCAWPMSLGSQLAAHQARVGSWVFKLPGVLLCCVMLLFAQASRGAGSWGPKSCSPAASPPALLQHSRPESSM